MSSSSRTLRPGVLALLLLVLVSSRGLRAQNPFLSTPDVPSSVRPPVAAPSRRLVDLQLHFRERVDELLHALDTEKHATVFFSLAPAAFLYGILHGAGPGHRKTIVFSVFLGRESRWYEPLAAGFLSAGLHAGTSVLLILIFSVLVHRLPVSMGLNITGIYFEGLTFLFLAVLALFFILRQVHSFRKTCEDRSKHMRKGGVFSVVAVSSLIPCPGATMLLIMALSLGVTWFGILGVLCMSLGMGIVISGAGYLAYGGRIGLFNGLKSRERLIAGISEGLELGSYLFILLFSLFMAWPFIVSGTGLLLK